MGFKGKGFGKGKGKGKRGPSGPDLPRTRITTEPVTGEVEAWKGKYGFIKPTVPVARRVLHASCFKPALASILGFEYLHTRAHFALRQSFR